jgi:hypothetical protein
LKIGAGGYMTGIDMTSDGVKVCRTDAYGCYVWRGSSWEQLLTTNSMPAADVDPDFATGSNEIVIAPSNTSRFYMAWVGRVYRSDNSGASWTRTGFTQVATNPATDNPAKAFGPYIAVDPVNADVLFYGPPSAKAWISTDAGASWTQISTFGTPTVPSGGVVGGGTIFKFDPSSSVTGSRTQGIYASVYGTGVYHSTDAGANWTLTTSTPTTHRKMDIGSNGVLWLTDNSNGSFNYNKYASATWSQMAPSGGGGGSGWSVAVDPADATHVVFVNSDGTSNHSTDNGANWSRVTTITRTASDVPWLAETNEGFFSNGAAMFDPGASNKLYVGEGIGIWYSTPPGTTWTSQSAGIENLIGNRVIAPTNGNPVVSAWDRPVFYVTNPDAYPADHGPDYDIQLRHGWALDWVAGAPATLVGMFNDQQNVVGEDASGKSTDGGQTWTEFAAKPSPFRSGGCIAAASASNYVWTESNQGDLFYTTNSGGTWTLVTPTGVPSSGNRGWGANYYVNRKNICADRVTANKFYAYNSGSDTPSTATGVWVSTDNGATWTRVFEGEVADFSGFAVTMDSVPGQAGHLFFTSGVQSAPHPSITEFMRSTDAGVSWAAVGDLTEVTAFGFGAIYPGQSYPAIYVSGWNNGTYGIWRSIDNASTWVKIGDYPLGVFSAIKSIDGHKTIPGFVYVATATGWFYGRT